MKKAFFGLAILASSFGILSFVETEKKDVTTYNVLNEYSKVEWNAAKKNNYHLGYFIVSNGSVNVENGKLTGGKFTIDMNSVTVTDAAGAGLDKHLKSKDFFETETFKEATFEITKVDYTTENNLTITGTANIKGVAVPVSFPAVIRSADDKLFFAQAFFSIDRTLWGINYGLDNIAKEVQLTVNLFAGK